MLPVEEEAGLGRIGKTEKCTLKEFCDRAVSELNCQNIKVCGNLEKTITKVAAIAGSGGGDEELFKTAVDMGADVIITSEVKHHIALTAKELDIAIIDACHHCTENIAVGALVQALNGYAEDRNIDIEVTQTAVNTNPFEY